MRKVDAIECAREAAAVAVGYSANAGAANEVVETIQASGGSASAVKANMAEQAEVDHMAEQVVDRFGRVVEKGSKVRSHQIGFSVLRPGLENADLAPHGPSSGWGALAEYTKATDAATLRADGITAFSGLSLSQQVVPGWMDHVDAVMVITDKETRSGLLQFGVKTGEAVVVIGAGPVGQCIERACECFGCHPVIVADRNQSRLERALAAGADATVNCDDGSFGERLRVLVPDACPFVVDAAASASVLNDALAVVANDGEALVYGVPPSSRLELNNSLAPYHWHVEYLIFPAFRNESAVHDMVISYETLELLEPCDIVDDVGPFAEFPHAMDRVASLWALKAVVCHA